MADEHNGALWDDSAPLPDCSTDCEPDPEPLVTPAWGPASLGYITASLWAMPFSGAFWMASSLVSGMKMRMKSHAATWRLAEKAIGVVCPYAWSQYPVMVLPAEPPGEK